MQFLPNSTALRARLEDLDGLPIINVNDVPLQGFNAWVKRALDVALSSAALAVLAVPFAIIAAVVKWSSPGPVRCLSLPSARDASQCR